MTLQIRDHDRTFDDWGFARVKRALVNGELRGVSADRAKLWLDARKGLLERWAIWVAVVGTIVVPTALFFIAKVS